MVCDRHLNDYSLEEEAGVLLVKHQSGKYKHTSTKRGMWRWKAQRDHTAVSSGYCFESAQEAAIAASQEAFYKDDVARLQSRAASASLLLTGVMARDEFTVGARP